VKRIILCFISSCFFALPCVAAVQMYANASSDNLDSLRNEITHLEKELATKTEKLNKCASKNKNFKIAGIATVGLTGVGVATNVAMHTKIKDQKKQIDNIIKKIDTADARGEEFLKEMERLLANVDEDRWLEELENTLTDEEWSRWEELSHEFEKDDVVVDDDFLDTNMVLFEKIIRSMRNSQKT